MRPFVSSVPLCEITKNVEIYNNRKVHIKTFLEAVGDNIYVDDGCINEDISIILAERVKEDTNILSLIRQLREARQDNSSPMIKVEIIGIMKDIRNDGITGIIDPQFEIEIQEIKPLSEIVFITDREQLKKLMKNR